MSDVAREIVDGLEDLAGRLKSGEPVEVTRVTREDTPDGPLHAVQRLDMRPLTPDQRRALGLPVTLTPPGAAVEVKAVPMPPEVRDGIARAFARRQEAADARFDAAWNAALGVLAVAALAAVLTAGWWPR